ncbi:MAG: 5-formyltetrahydrofolate cyclo-ligase [Proteobacteria bacterium]|nr:5-formyltetrahydrofolate cyclo-ligase [Pseudomonadota bacterium]
MNLKIYKNELRKKILIERDKLTEEEIIFKSSMIKDNLWKISEFTLAKNIFLFVNFRSEVRTIPIIERCFEEEKKVILPLTDVENKRLLLYYVENLKGLKEGAYGILEPSPEIHKSANVKDIDCAIVPGSAFDESGGRMGYGGGFYDRLLPDLRPEVKKIGIAFELQIIEKVPLGYYDQKMDIIVTEKRIIRIKNA